MKEIFLSIIIPVFNEEKRIENTILEIQKYLKNNLKNNFCEIFVVNDGSIDKTEEVLLNLQKSFSNLFYLNFPKNVGKGCAVKAGMLLTEGKYKLFMDADNSVKINNLEFFLQEIEKGFDIVVASIFLPESKIIHKNTFVSFYKKILGKISRIFVRTFFLKNISDTQRGFKLFTKKAAEKTFKKQTIKRFAFDIEILLIAEKLNFKIKEIPVIWENSLDSRVKLKDYFSALYDLLKIFFNMV